MADNRVAEGRRIVTCDDCGTPYAAVESGDAMMLVGGKGEECPNCAGTEFSTLQL